MAAPLGIAVGGLTLFGVLILGAILVRRRGGASGTRYPLNIIDVDEAGGGGGSGLGPALDPVSGGEESHQKGKAGGNNEEGKQLRMNGYENPTYHYYEERA